ncbi:alpha-hydroxy-acid oxidizing protein, partial [Immundisolibacter sp.]|uniref:alpha-hydroxy-acid oxidizing protein n=1 Tax=Immundisolibacter sp. TaxID=1934948 RepID=UPI003568D485
GGAGEVILDSGVRRGADILKALALGARACMIGKAALYGLAAGGEAGVARVLAILRQELDVAMALTGTHRADAVQRDTLRD